MTIPYTPPPLPPYDVLVEYLNASNLASQGMIQFATVSANLYYNAVGSWNVLLPYSDALWNMMMSGDFIIRVTWRGLFNFGGKCEQPTYIDSIPGSTAVSAGAGGNIAGPFINLSGADYLALIANRICYPDPTKAWSAQLSASQDVVVNTPLETAIKHYVLVNVGNQAISSRQHPLLDVAADQGRGPNVNYSVKFGSNVNLNLFDVIRALIAQAYGTTAVGMGVSIVQNGSRLSFDVYIPPDKSASVTFSEQLGNLTSISFSLTDPLCTDALIQGASTVTPSPFVQKTAAGVTAWTKVEQFVDSTSETVLNNLNTTAADLLFSGAMGPNMATTTSDMPYLVYGRDYAIGDKVSVEVRPGDIYTDIISGVVLTCDPSQMPIMSAVPTIGNSSNSTSTDKNVYNQLLARIKQIEKTLATKGG